MAEAIIKKSPSKIDIGPVYSHDPRDRQKWASKRHYLIWKFVEFGNPTFNFACTPQKGLHCFDLSFRSTHLNELHLIPVLAIGQSRMVHHLQLVCLASPAADSSTPFVPIERELVFDIDLTDYDDVRTCGKEGHICTKCWPLMAAAIQVIFFQFSRMGATALF